MPSSPYRFIAGLFSGGNGLCVEFDLRRPNDGDVVGPGFVFGMPVVNPVEAGRKIVGLTLIDLRQRVAFQTPPAATRHRPAMEFLIAKPSWRICGKKRIFQGGIYFHPLCKTLFGIRNASVRVFSFIL